MMCGYNVQSMKVCDSCLGIYLKKFVIIYNIYIYIYY